MRYFKGDYKYVLAEDYDFDTGIASGGAELSFCSITPAGNLRVRRGYAWDGPSGPTIDTRSFMRGSLIHDALYQLLRETDFGNRQHHHKRESADSILHAVCLKDGMWAWRAGWVYRCVRAGGVSSAEAKKRKVHTAP